ncbi:MAG: 2-hydroxyacid dehydrogenase [Peptococcaceae bacterium BICA1-7]|nr:MAG: 2-hydroxyacid dehydrogenase [Peptococcaceae bacterium BICA1-7]HBV97483.1 hydroxyacid dehydrogenase [Desulfotomaculum sp.]
MAKIVVTELIWEEGLDILRAVGEVIYDPDLWKKETLESSIRDSDALIVRNQTKVTEGLIAPASKLKVVGRLGVGLDNIDIGACKKAGVEVVFARNANAISVAEYVFAAMLSFSRQPYKATEDVKNGNWNRKKFTLSELYGKTLGLIGVGEIGTRLAARARAFGMNILGHDPFLPPYEVAITELGVSMTSLENLLSESDFISLHVPLNENTRNFINKESLSLMKPTACIINTARGGIINEQDLYEALLDKRIAGAALDVLSKEPPQGSPLLDLDNVILTPHIAGLTEEAQVRTSVLVAKEVVKVLRGQASCCSVR